MGKKLNWYSYIPSNTSTIYKETNQRQKKDIFLPNTFYYVSLATDMQVSLIYKKTKNLIGLR